MHYSIIGFDIERYTEDHETDKLQEKRTMVGNIIRDAINNSELGRLQQQNSNNPLIDTGDGFFSFIDSRDFSKILNFFSQIRIIAKNKKNVRFRGILHQGECTQVPGILTDKKNWLDSDDNIIGNGFNETARFLDSNPLKELLRFQTDEFFVFGISRDIYNEILEQPYFDKPSFHEYSVIVKEFRDSIYLFSTNQTLPEDDKVRNIGTLRPIHESIREQVPSDNLPRRPSLCIGRNNVISEIQKKLLSGGSAYIHGHPGVGKTTLASEVAWQFKEHSCGYVIYIFSLNLTFDDILNTIARFFLETGLIELTQYDKEREIKSLLTQKLRVLIYLDNVESPELIRNIEILSISCSLLVTSRMCLPLNWPLIKELEMLERSSSIELFKKIYNQPISYDDIKYIDETCKKLGDMPLAIDLCSHRARISKIPINRLPSLLKKHLLKYLEFKDRSVYASISLTYDNLDKVKKRFFVMLSLFGGRTFCFDAVNAMWKNEDSIDLQNQLMDLSLIKAVGDGRFFLHPVIHEFSEIKFRKFKGMIGYLIRMIEYFCTFAEDNRADSEQLEIERENIFAVMNECDKKTDVEHYLRIAEALLKRLPGHYAYGFLAQKGYWDKAVEILDRCLELTKDTKLRAKFFEHLGLFNYWKGEHDKANEYYKKALSLCRENKDYQGEAVILQRQGFIKSDEGFYKECENLYRCSEEIARTHELPERVLADGLSLVGVILYHQCRYEESKEKLEEALSIRERYSVAESVTLRRLAGTYRRLNRILEAEKILYSCLETDKKAGNDRNIARCLRQLGMVKQKQGLIDDALSYFEESYDIFRKIGNKKGIASVLSNIGEINIKLENLDVAESGLRESLCIAKELRSKK